MTVRLDHFILFIVVVAILLGGLFWWRVSPRVFAEVKSPYGHGLIVVREIQISPFSIYGILRVSDCIYRCEYYPWPEWPMCNAKALWGESCYVSKKDVQCQWLDRDTAIVRLGNGTTYKCERGNWSEVPQLPQTPTPPPVSQTQTQKIKKDDNE